MQHPSDTRDSQMQGEIFILQPSIIDNGWMDTQNTVLTISDLPGWLLRTTATHPCMNETKFGSNIGGRGVQE